jgi:UDP-2-acetamido-2,6-beta-L-arabino-hexul-4-ose reductase
LIRVLITGANGFLGKSLQLHLTQRPDVKVVRYTRQDEPARLPALLRRVDVVFHLAGVNRPQDPGEYQVGNTDLTRELANAVRDEIQLSGAPVSVVFASSVQADLPNSYGLSKFEAEQALWDLQNMPGVCLYMFRLPNVFGKWCRPNYNSVVATFCHNITRDMPIQIKDPDAPLTLVYVDDVLTQFMLIIDQLLEVPAPGDFAEVNPQYQTTVGELASRLRGFRESRATLMTDRVGQGLTRALYATYVSYLPVDEFVYDIPRHSDPRGVFVEMLKTHDAGQFSYFTAHPGATRGGHYHHSKTEKFLVIKGSARFRFRHMQTGQIHELDTHGVTPQIVETVPGWTHDITNVGLDEMIVMLWANEVFDRNRPDTFTCPVCETDPTRTQ